VTRAQWHQHKSIIFLQLAWRRSLARRYIVKLNKVTARDCVRVFDVVCVAQAFDGQLGAPQQFGRSVQVRSRRVIVCCCA
jgi:hypothetical protein